MIEECSLFSTELKKNRIVGKERKVKHIRKLDEFEVLMLIFQEMKIEANH